VRVGISWRLDDCEPTTAIVTQVIHGSAAHAAGLRLGDRIYSLGGRGFASQAQLVDLLNRAASPFDMLIERSGKLQNLRLTLPGDPAAAE
jgi:S1-C subfamily serine protease